MKRKATIRKYLKVRAHGRKPVRLQRVVSVPRGYKRVAAQMDAIRRQFMDGASMTRLSRKHSLPKSTIEFIIRMKMLGYANAELTDGSAKTNDV